VYRCGATHAYKTLPAGMIPCARCGTAIAQRTADYDPRGQMVCTTCSNANDLEATEGAR
jgi:formylmethanofuran dehydrogenase subunit E